MRRVGAVAEAFLDAERDQLALWLPVALGAGIAAWFVLDGAAQWLAWLFGMAALAWGSWLLPSGSRLRRVVLIAAIASAVGCGTIWTRAMWLAGPVLTRPAVATFTGRIERVEVQTARDRVRLTLVPVNAPDLPPKVRVTVDDVIASAGLVRGDHVTLRARLVGPPSASVPGGFDFSRVAWFQGLGATGKAIGPVKRIGPPSTAGPTMRDRLSAHIRTRLEGSAGGIDCALADIVVSDRRLPPWCRPRWFKADRVLLAQTGGIAVTLASRRVETVAESEGAHPWVVARKDRARTGAVDRRPLTPLGVAESPSP